jgi:sigma-E factor negative regulatory protein RseB
LSRALGALVLCAAASWAHAQTSPDAVAWLRRIYQATEQLSYTGTFVYQQGERTETSRIAHLAGASGGTEKLEVLEGAAREILRTRNEIRCYLPDRHLVKVEPRGDPRAFPAVLPEQVTALSEYYAITMGHTGRIAGFDCQAVELKPLDEMRYGYRLWADTRSGMLLKAQTFKPDGAIVEQFTFAQLDIGAVARDRLRPPRMAKKWRVEQAAVAPADLASMGWQLEPAVPGFRKVVEIRRMLRDSEPVDQVVFSDGLAAISVFIEPKSKRTEASRDGLSGMGAVNVVTRHIADHLVTVVGETPVVSVQRIADGVSYKKPE